MTEITPQIQADFTNKLLKEFAEGLDEVLKNRISAISGKVPSQTLSLIRYKIIEASASDISAKYELYFQDSGRLSEMKNLKGGNPLPVDAILEWIRRGRSSLFRKTPGYTKSPSRLSQAKKEERIATAIAFAKAKGTRRRGKKLKERQWINKNIYGWYNRLVSDFITQQSEVLREMIKQGFEGLENIEV